MFFHQPLAKAQPAPPTKQEWESRTVHSAQPLPALRKPSSCKPIFLHPIQTKLLLGSATNRFEQEADQIAQQVVNQLHAPSPQTSEPTPMVQGKPTPEEDPHGDPEVSPIQRQMAPPAEGAVSTELETTINQARGSGHALPKALQGAMEHSLNANLSSVRIHRDAQADRLNRAIQARAFTSGQDIFFRQGEYNPKSRTGQELIAHEIAHTLQQRKPIIQHPGPEHSTLQMARPRSASIPLSQGDSGGKVACYGVSQGHYKTIGMFDGMIGTSSLGSCFAVIVHSGPSVFFCHVHACSEEVLNNFASLISVGSAKIVKGKAPSENTNNLIDLLVQKGATVHGGTGTGAVVYNPLKKEISTPGDIQPTNDDYLAKNGVGAKMKADEALQSM